MRSQAVRFTFRILLILLPFGLLFGFTEYRARRLPSSYARKKEAMEKTKDSIEVLILGSSHNLKGINPRYLSLPAVNLANSSQTIFFDTRLCLRYLDSLPRLRVVVMEISYISLWYDLSDSPEFWRSYFYYHYFGISSPGINRFSPPALFYSALYSRGIINDIIFNRLNEQEAFGRIDDTGWEYSSFPADPRVLTDSAGRERVKLHNSLIRAKNGRPVSGYLTEMMTALTERNILVVFVSTPVWRCYSDHLDPDVERLVHDQVLYLCESYDAIYLDHSRDSAFRREDFSDNDHLNAAGAEKFTGIVNRMILAHTGAR